MQHRILVVEDEPDLGELWAEYLTALGHDVAIAASRAAVVDYLEAGGVPELAFVDWTLPDGRGDDVIRLLEVHADQCAVVVTSGLGVRVPPDLLPRVRTVLCKPFSLSDLHAALTALDG